MEAPTTSRSQQTQARVDHIRAQIAEQATGQGSVNDLHDRVQQLAQAQAVADLEVQVCHRMAWQDTDEATARAAQAEETIEELLQTGADDTWSGRSNDLRRATFDAKRNWANAARREAAARS